MSWGPFDHKPDASPEEATLAEIGTRAAFLQELILRLHGKPIPHGGQDAFDYLQKIIRLGPDGESLSEQLQRLLRGQPELFRVQVASALGRANTVLNFALRALICESGARAEAKAIDALQTAKGELERAISRDNAS